MRLAPHLLALALVALPGAARAQSLGNQACGSLVGLLWLLAPPQGQRTLALDLLAGTDLNTAPALPLAPQDTLLRFGPEARLSFGVSRGYELFASVGLLLPGAGGTEALRGQLGATVNWDLGGRTVFYVLASAGLWLTSDLQADLWGPGLSNEMRAGVGLRLPTGLGTGLTMELGTGLRFLQDTQSHPILLLRVGFGLGA